MTQRTVYGYAESSDIKATTAGHIFSVVDEDNDLENGMIVKLGEITEPDEIYSIDDAAKTDKIVLILDPAINAELSTKAANAEIYYHIPAGKVARAYEIVEHDRYAISDNLVTALDKTAGAKKGNYLVVDGRKYKEIASMDDSYGFVAKIVNKVAKSNLTILRLDVIKNTTVAAAKA